MEKENIEHVDQPQPAEMCPNCDPGDMAYKTRRDGCYRD